MPTYTFKNNDTGDVYDISLTLSERDDYVKEHNVTQQLTSMVLVSGVGGIKTSDGFKDILKTIKKNSPRSNINV